MSNVIELEEIYFKENKSIPLFLNLSKVIAICKDDNICYVYAGGKRFRVTEDSYDKLCKELKAYNEGNIVDKLYELQNDNIWVKQAITNLTLMLNGADEYFNPAILIDCKDALLEKLYNNCYRAACEVRERIKDLKHEINIMTEPKKPSNV